MGKAAQTSLPLGAFLINDFSPRTVSACRCVFFDGASWSRNSSLFGNFVGFRFLSGGATCGVRCNAGPVGVVAVELVVCRLGPSARHDRVVSTSRIIVKYASRY